MPDGIQAGLQVPPNGGSCSGHNDPGNAMGNEMQTPPSAPGCSGFNDGGGGCVMGNEMRTVDAKDSAPAADFND